MRENYLKDRGTHRFPLLTNVVLVGLSGSGKSTIGKNLAWQLGLGFLDLDDAIEASEKKKIHTICVERGISHFRDLESKSIMLLASIRNHVIAVGGGALENEENYKVLESLGLLTWIDTPVSTIAWRLANNPAELKKRPLLADLYEERDKSSRCLKLQARLDSMLSEREHKYKEAAISLRDCGSAPEICARRLIHLMDRHWNGKKAQKSPRA